MTARVPATTRVRLAGIADTLASAATTIEESFVAVGDGLYGAVAQVAALTRTFEKLSATLTGENLARSARELTQVGARIATLAQVRGDTTGRLGRIIASSITIGQRVGRMSASVAGIGTVATNAKIAVAQIPDAGNELANFAEEINGTLRTARRSLDSFASALTGVGRLLHASRATQSELEARQDEAVSAIGPRLQRGVAAIAARTSRAAETARTVGAGSQRVERDIGTAIMALQIGDITRQRVEHVGEALGLLAGMGATAAPDGGAADAFVGLVCRLQAALLTEAANTLDREAERVLASLENLATSADEILQSGHATFGVADTADGSFLGTLEQNIGEVETLLGGFRAARLEADQLAASISSATGNLVANIVKVRSLEADIRIMGLNMSLRCGRLGAAGRPLIVVAQELRNYAKEIAANATQIKTELDGIVAVADSLTGQGEDAGEDALSAISGMMSQSLARLAGTGDELTAAAAALERDGVAVASLLRDAVAKFTGHRGVGDVLREAAAALGESAPDAAYDHAGATPDELALLDSLARSYTMESERAIFARHCPTLARQTEAPPETEALEDIFF